jgi:SAM-dependent methyltransferase
MNLITDNSLDIEMLSAHIRRAQLYERTNHYIWTDDHVGRQMLKFHLDPNLDSASLKHTTIDSQVRWIASRIGDASLKELLDIGCGPGLYCERFHSLGFHVTGLDFNRHSLQYASARARENQLSIKYVLKDYVHLDYREQFDVITLINRDFGALTPVERDMLLCAVHRSLKRGGRFVFDALSLEYFARLQESSRFSVCTAEGFWSPGPHIVLEQVLLYPESHAQLDRQIVIAQDGEVRKFHNWLTYYNESEIEQMLRATGFEVVETNPFLSDEIYDSPDLYLGFIAAKR